jgi:hypothetical protein
MDFDKWTPEKREIENLDSCYMNFKENKPHFGVGDLLRTRMRHIDLIDWTSAANQLSVDYAKPHLQFLGISGVQISLDAFSGSNPEI